jgi:tripeptidyl-peptidase-1
MVPKLLIAVLSASSLVSGAALHEQLASVPAGWSHTDTPSDDTQLVMQIALAQQNIDQLESKLAAVSTPDSAKYGQYLDEDSVAAAFAPSAATTKAVTSWLSSAGVDYTVKGDSVWFKAPVSKANTLLSTTFKTYTDGNGVSKIRTTQYSIPDSLKSHIDLISPTTYFGKTQVKQIKATYAIDQVQTPSFTNASLAAAGCNFSISYGNHSYKAIKPSCLKYIYNVGNYTPDPAAGSKIAFGSFLNESASFSDLALYEQYFGIPSQK